jgi:hypothetical protein
MGLVSSLVQRASGAGRRPATGGLGRPSVGRTGGSAGTRAKDEAVGRGVRSVLGRLRRR